MISSGLAVTQTYIPISETLATLGCQGKKSMRMPWPGGEWLLAVTRRLLQFQTPTQIPIIVTTDMQSFF